MSFVTSLVDALLERPFVRSAGPPAFRATVMETRLSRAYWRVAPSFHRRRRQRSAGYVDSPTDPFELVHLDPDRITRFTGREFPVWTDRWRKFGAVVDGDWDERALPPVSDSYRGPDPELYLAHRFVETPLHRALRKHFVDDVPWEAIPLVKGLMRNARQTEASVWQNCSTTGEIREYCRELDRLYDSMREDGCLPMREVNAREERNMTFRAVMENEILVDVARDGEPLFVSGRHRLSIAKILGLDRVPVAVAVRHPEWVDRHDRLQYSAAPRRTAAPSDRKPIVGEPIDVPW